MYSPIKTMHYNTKNKARFSRLLEHPAWKWRGPIPMSALLQICYSDIYPLTYSPRTHTGHKWQ